MYGMRATFRAPIKMNVASSPVTWTLQTPRQLETFTEDFSHASFIGFRKLIANSIRHHTTNPFEYKGTVCQLLFWRSGTSTQHAFAVNVVG